MFFKTGTFVVNSTTVRSIHVESCVMVSPMANPHVLIYTHTDGGTTKIKGEKQVVLDEYKRVMEILTVQ